MKTENPKTQREIPDEIEGKCKHIQIYIYIDFYRFFAAPRSVSANPGQTLHSLLEMSQEPNG
mgnify:CR=1 FL=1